MLPPQDREEILKHSKKVYRKMTKIHMIVSGAADVRRYRGWRRTVGYQRMLQSGKLRQKEEELNRYRIDCLNKEIAQERDEKGFSTEQKYPLTWIQAESSIKPTIKDVRRHRQVLETLRSADIFYRLHDPSQDRVKEQLEYIQGMNSQKDGAVDDIQLFANELLDLLSAPPSEHKLEVLTLGWEQPGQGLYQALAKVADDAYPGTFTLHRDRIICLLLDPAASPALPYLFADNFRKQLVLESPSIIEVLVRFLSGNPTYDHSVLGFISPKAQLEKSTREAILRLARNAPVDSTFHLGLLPLLASMDSPQRAATLMSVLKKAISSTVVHSSHPQAAEEWPKLVAAAIAKLETWNPAVLAEPLVDFVISQPTLQAQTRLLGNLVLFLATEDANEVQEELLISLKRQLPPATFQSLCKLLVNLNPQSNPRVRELYSLLPKGSDNFPKHVKDHLASHPTLSCLLDVDTQLGFSAPSAQRVRETLSAFRPLLSAISQKLRRLTIGEYESLRSVRNLVQPAAFVSHSNFQTYFDRLGGDEFDNTFQFLSAVKDDSQVFHKNSRSDSLTNAVYQGRFLKGLTFRRGLYRRFSTVPVHDDDIPAPESASDASTAKQQWSQAFASSGKTQAETENLLQSDITLDEFRQAFDALVQHNAKNPKGLMGIFSAVFRSPQLVSWAAEVFGDTKIPENKRFAGVMFEAGSRHSPTLDFKGETRLGLMPLDLNAFTIRKEFDGMWTPEVIERQLKVASLRLNRAQYFVLFNLHMRTPAGPSPDLSKAFLDVCLEHRWPKTLIQSMHLLHLNNALDPATLAVGLAHLARFRYMASEGIDLFAAVLRHTLAEGLDPVILKPIVESMVDCGQVSEVFLRFEDLKNLLLTLRYQDDLTKSAEDNEKDSASLRGRLEDFRRNLYSVMFGLAVRSNVTQQAVLLYAEIMSFNGFRTLEDAMNLLRFGRRSQSDLNNALTVIKDGLKYTENPDMVFPPEYVSEWLEVFQAGNPDLLRNAVTLIRMFFFNRSKTPIQREHLASVLRLTLLHDTYNVLNAFLELLSRDKRAVKEMGEDAKEGVLAVISRCTFEDTRVSMIEKVDQIFKLQYGGEGSRRSKEERLEAISAAYDRFQPIWESRLEKYQERVFENVRRVRPRPRPFKDKRSFLRQTFEPMVEHELAMAKEKLGMNDELENYEWVKERKERKREIADMVRKADAVREAEFESKGLFATQKSDYDEYADEPSAKEKKKQKAAQNAGFKKDKAE